MLSSRWRSIEYVSITLGAVLAIAAILAATYTTQVWRATGLDGIPGYWESTRPYDKYSLPLAILATLAVAAGVFSASTARRVRTGKS
jgi:formate hydrogenlyase subunit 3/multisubunit Na+/H+ antiporter MnhD subunit